MAKRIKRKPSRVSEETVSVAGRRMSKKKHGALLDYLMSRLAPHVYTHRTKIREYDTILRGLAAKVSHEGWDKKKIAAYHMGKTNVVTQLRYPKTLGHINDISYGVVNLLFPARHMYGSVELTVREQKATAAVVNELNNSARAFKHYTNMFKSISDAIAFNIGIVSYDWQEVKGFLGKSRIKSSNVTQNTNVHTIRDGTVAKHRDIYNTILDYNASTEFYSSEAELIAYVDKKSDFDLLRMAAQGEVILTEAVKKNLRGVEYRDGEMIITNKEGFYSTFGSMLGCDKDSYGNNKLGGLYQERSEFRNFIDMMAEKKLNSCDEKKRYSLADDMRDGNDWGTSDEKPSAQNEVLTLVIRMNASKFGIGDSKLKDDLSSDMEIWEVVILNGEDIIGVKQVGLAHGLLPATITRPKAELAPTTSLSIAELLMPFQEASSSLINMYLDQVRSDKNKGVTFYRKKSVKLEDMSDPTSGYVGVDDIDDMGKKIPLRDQIHNVQGHQVNTNTITADQHLNTKMQDVFPTQSVDNLANMNRPVTHQSRQLTQLQNLPIFVLARFIHEEMIEPGMYMQTQDTLANRKNLKYIDEAGEEVDVPPESLEELDLSLAVSDGLRGIDNIAIADRMGDLIQHTLQTPENLREYDIGKMQSYLMMLEGAHIDFDAFKHKNPFDALPPEAKQAAVQLLQQQQAQAQEEEANSQQ